jgi:FtsZ-binding cell division protein ZapB
MEKNEKQKKTVEQINALQKEMDELDKEEKKKVADRIISLKKELEELEKSSKPADEKEGFFSKWGNKILFGVMCLVVAILTLGYVTGFGSKSKTSETITETSTETI